MIRDLHLFQYPGHSLGGSPRSKNQGTSSRATRSGKKCFERISKTNHIGIVTNQTAVLKKNSIDRTDSRSTRAQFVEIRDDGFFVGDGHIESSQCRVLFQQSGKGCYIGQRKILVGMRFR